MGQGPERLSLSLRPLLVSLRPLTVRPRTCSAVSSSSGGGSCGSSCGSSCHRGGSLEPGGPGLWLGLLMQT